MKELDENEISYLIRGAIFKVYNNLGPGLLESIYKGALHLELTKLKLSVKSEIRIPVVYDGTDLNFGFRLDLLVNDKIIIEIKSVETLLPVHHKQLLTYLRLTDKKLGLLVNFNTVNLSNSISRVVNNL